MCDIFVYAQALIKYLKRQSISPNKLRNRRRKEICRVRSSHFSFVLKEGSHSFQAVAGEISNVFGSTDVAHRHLKQKKSQGAVYCNFRCSKNNQENIYPLELDLAHFDSP